MSFPLELLPNELLSQLTHYLNPFDRQSFGRVSRRFARLVDGEGYLTGDSQNIWIDYEKQVMSAQCYPKGPWFFCFNGTLDFNEKPAKEDGSILLNVPFWKDGNKQIARNLGNSWQRCMQFYVAKMERVFCEIKKEVNRIRILLPQFHLPLPKGLTKLREVNVKELSVERVYDGCEWKPFPVTLLKMMDKCSSVDIYDDVTLSVLFQLSKRAEKIVCGIAGTDAITIMQLFLNGTLPGVTQTWALHVSGDREVLYEEACVHEVDATLTISWLTELPKAKQLNGGLYRLSVRNHGKFVDIDNITNWKF